MATSDPAKAEVARLAQALLNAYIATDPRYVEYVKVHRLAMRNGVQFVYGNERGRYVVRDDTGAEVLVIDLRSWRAAEET